MKAISGVLMENFETFLPGLSTVRFSNNDSAAQSLTINKVEDK
jgi:hypothetical protein